MPIPRGPRSSSGFALPKTGAERGSKGSASSCSTRMVRSGSRSMRSSTQFVAEPVAWSIRFRTNSSSTRRTLKAAFRGRSCRAQNCSTSAATPRYSLAVRENVLWKVGNMGRSTGNLGGREQNAQAFFDVVDHRDALVYPHGLEHLFDLRLRIEQDHLRTVSLEGAGAGYEHAHAERGDEFEPGDIHQGRLAAGRRVAMEFHVDGVKPGDVELADDRQVSNAVVHPDFVQL